MAWNIHCGYLFAHFYCPHHGQRYVILFRDIWNNLHNGPPSAILDATNFPLFKPEWSFKKHKSSDHVSLLFKILQWYSENKIQTPFINYKALHDMILSHLTHFIPLSPLLDHFVMISPFILFTTLSLEVGTVSHVAPEIKMNEWSTILMHANGLLVQY